ncbi:GGDEF domain-containing protein [Burkholderia alba]|uniref:GGDEF domain-containing protein n=1 Tax=Burkholderia alba TaxID=2683677 RepID=UPI002B06103C|nr:diguanylate cyclase [Burkholderia alba]
MPLGYAVIAGGVAVAIVMMSICAAILRDSRADAFERAQDAARNTLLMIERDVSRNFHIYDLTLQGVVESINKPWLAGLPLELRREVLFDRAAAADFIGVIYVLDANGRIKLSSNGGAVPTRSFADCDFFIAQRDDPDLGMYVGSPYRARLIEGDPSIALSRRIDTPDGRFDGIVVMAVRLAYFRRLMSGMEVGEHGSLGLVHENGQLVMRMPYEDGMIGRDLRGTGPYTRMLFSRSGSFSDVASVDGVKRYYLYQRIDGVPLVVQVAVAEQDIYAEWRSRAWRFGMLTTAFSIAFVAMSLCLAHSLWRKSAAEAALARLAGTDSLTGLHNRRALDETLEREWRRAVRGGRPLAILFVDIDHFKRYNDAYGHQVGDEVLTRVARCIAGQASRAGDAVARYGGEEFVVVLPDTDPNGARVVAERIRLAVRLLAIAHEQSEVGFVTVSIGVAVWEPHDGVAAPEVAAVVEAADQALYQAKASGRNRVVHVRLG